jgi:cytochrome c biogenesis protein
VRFAVVLIALVALAGLVGILVRQLSLRALGEPAAYAREMADIHARWEGLQPLGLPVGPLIVDAFEAAGFFRVFTSPWFFALLTILAVSIVCCTLDRLPRLWREVRRVRVDQPAAFFDPRLDHRVVLTAPAAPVAATAPVVAAAMKGARLGVREATAPDGSFVSVYGDRNRHMKLATLLTHAGLVLFLVGGAITAGWGFETVLFVADGQSAPVQPVGTPGNLLVRNLGFEAPRRPDGSFEDFRTDLAVYRDGSVLARKTIRVNDPLEAGGFVFHQNTFGPSADLEIRDAAGALAWSGPVVLAGELLGLPQGFLTIPGSEVGLVVLLERSEEGTRLLLQGVGVDAANETRTLFIGSLPLGATSEPGESAGYAITWREAGAWTGMVVKRDPGQPVIWLAFGLLISGLVLTFYFPRRRVWARVEEGRVSLAMLADRYVDVDRELGRLREDVARALASEGTPIRAADGPRL